MKRGRVWRHHVAASAAGAPVLSQMFVQVCACIHQPVWPGTTRRSQIERGCVGRVPRVPNPRWPRSKKGTQAQHRALAPSTQHQARAPRARAVLDENVEHQAQHRAAASQPHRAQHRAPTQQQHRAPKHRAGAAPSTQHQARARAPSAQQQQQQQRGSRRERGGHHPVSSEVWCIPARYLISQPGGLHQLPQFV